MIGDVWVRERELLWSDWTVWRRGGDMRREKKERRNEGTWEEKGKRERGPQKETRAGGREFVKSRLTIQILSSRGKFKFLYPLNCNQWDD